MSEPTLVDLLVSAAAGYDVVAKAALHVGSGDDAEEAVLVAARLRAAAERLRSEMAKAPRFEWRDGMGRPGGALTLLERINGGPLTGGNNHG